MNDNGKVQRLSDEELALLRLADDGNPLGSDVFAATNESAARLGAASLAECLKSQVSEFQPATVAGNEEKRNQS